MLKFGEEPYLECSSRGDKRFSAYYAKLRGINSSIEKLYQGSKLIDGKRGWSIEEAKGKKAENDKFCKLFYSGLWAVYFEENPELYEVIKQYNGFSDIFGQEGHCCQAEEIYRIWLTLTR